MFLWFWYISFWDDILSEAFHLQCPCLLKSCPAVQQTLLPGYVLYWNEWDHFIQHRGSSRVCDGGSLYWLPFQGLSFSPLRCLQFDYGRDLPLTLIRRAVPNTHWHGNYLLTPLWGFLWLWYYSYACTSSALVDSMKFSYCGAILWFC